MTLQRLLNTIGIIGVRDRMVNFTGCGGSVYELNDLTIKNYPILYVSPTGTHRVEENYTTYQLTIFYIDRLLEDNSNAVDIHSAAVEILKNIIRTIENTDGVIGVSDEYSINLFTETEKFKDRCNGAYATVEISVVNDTVCEAEYDDYNGEPGTSKYIQFTNPAEFDNTFIAHDVPFFVFRWRTSEPSTHYMIYRFIGAEYSIIMEGDTNQTVLFFDGLGNSGNTEITYEMQISNDAGGESRILRQLPYYFLNFTNQNNVQLSADTNDYLINWETNLETVGWKLYRNDTLYSSGQTTNTSIMAQFPVNTSDASVSYRFVAGYPGGGFERTLNWTQAAAVNYYFNVTNPEFPLMTMQPSESSYTVNFETNCEGDITFKILQCSMCGWVGEYVWKYGTPKQIVVPRPSYRTDDHEEWLVYHPYYNGSEIQRYFGIEVQKFYFDISTEDNQKIDSTATSFTINYQTNYSEVSYTFGDVTGTTSGGTLTVTFPENTGASAVAMEILFQDSDGNVVGTVHWSQNQANTYFNILTASGQTISPAATAFTIEYETNMTPPYAYSYTDSEGVTIWRNSWSPSSLTINFSPNDSQSVRERTVRLALRDINWYQEVPYLNFTSYPSEISGERQLVCFGWECNTGGKVKYELYSGNTQYGEMDYVRSGRTDSMSGDCITFSANTGDDRYYQLDIAASFAGSDTYYVVFDSITFKQEGANDSGVTPDTSVTINSAITNDYTVGSPILDVDDIIPYGYYVMRWEKEGTYGKLTRALNDYYVTDRYMSGFIDAHVDNGVMHASDAQKVRILQAIPREDTELSGVTLYYYQNNQENVYTGASYLFYDIYVGKYVSWRGGSGLEHLDMSVFVDNPPSSPLVWNILNGSADGNRIGSAGANVRRVRSAWLPMKREYIGHDCITGTEQRSESAYPYNHPNDWDDVKITIIPITEVQ